MRIAQSGTILRLSRSLSLALVRKQVLCFLDELDESLDQFARILKYFAIGISQGAVFVAEITDFRIWGTELV